MGLTGDITGYFFPVTIVERYDVLYIVDRRPNLALMGYGLGAIGLGIFTAFLGYQMFLHGWAWWIVLLALGTIGLAVMALKSDFQEVYVFDKPADTYTFTRRNLFGSDEQRGTLSEFHSVQIHEVTGEDSEAYAVVLLMQGMMFGRSSTQVLRENRPLFNSESTEWQIAEEISAFLKIPNNGTVNVSSLSS